jgi:hypothetical protein
MLLDWLGGDTKTPVGLQLLWPFSDRWYISSWELFRATRLSGFFTVPTILSNGTAVLRELLLLGPFALAVLYVRRRMLSARSGPAYTWPPQRLLPEDPQS